MSKQTKSSSLLDVVGADINSSYDRSMQFQIASDTFHISSGGAAAIAGNTQIQIQLRDDNAIHYLKRSGIAFEADVAGFCHNAAMFFTGLELSIGNVVISTPYQHYYVQQRIAKYGKKEMEKYSHGLALNIDLSDQTNAVHATAGFTNLMFTQANDNSVTGSVVDLANPYSSLHRTMNKYWSDRQEVGTKVKCFVPFHLIFPCIEDLPDDGAVFTGYGSSVKMNIRTNIASDFVCQNVVANVAPDYTLSNMVLLKCFSKLDQPRADLILKSSISFPLCKYVQWQQPITTTAINAIFSISKDDLIRGLWFGFHSNVSSANTAEATNLSANIANAVPCQFKNPLAYFPQFPIQQLTLNIGGELILFNNQAIQFLHVTDDAIADGRPTYQNPVLHSIKHAYHIDLRRFSDDLFGSSAKQSTTVQLQIQLRQGAGSETLKLQGAGGWAAGISAFQFMAYLETMSFMDLKSGVYSQ